MVADVGLGFLSPAMKRAMQAAAQRRAQEGQRQANRLAQRGGFSKVTVPKIATAMQALLQRRRPVMQAGAMPVTVTPPILIAQPGWTPPVISTDGPTGATTPLDTGATDQMATDAAAEADAQPAVLKAGLPGGPVGALLVLGLVLAFVGRKRR